LEVARGSEKIAIPVEVKLVSLDAG